MPKFSPFSKPKECPIPGAKEKFKAKLTKGEAHANAKASFSRAYTENERKAIYARNRSALDKEKAKADERVWQIDGMLMNRYEVMEYFVIMVSAGADKVSLCRLEEFPTLLQIESWQKRHPDFKVALENAERIRGIILGEEQVKIVMDANPGNAGLAKIQAEVVGKAAARLNAKYQDKQVIETTDITEQLTRGQIEEKLRTLQERFPKLKEIGMKPAQDAELVENKSQDGDE